MGEYAEMMLDGTCCTVCGELLGGSEGYPVTCAGCADDDFDPIEIRKPFACQECGKRFTTEAGRDQHFLVKHKDREWTQCPHCERKCRGQRGLQDHIAAKHSDNPKPKPRVPDWDDADFDLFEDEE